LWMINSLLFRSSCFCVPAPSSRLPIVPYLQGSGCDPPRLFSPWNFLQAQFSSFYPVFPVFTHNDALIHQSPPEINRRTSMTELFSNSFLLTIPTGCPWNSWDGILLCDNTPALGQVERSPPQRDPPSANDLSPPFSSARELPAFAQMCRNNSQ